MGVTEDPFGSISIDELSNGLKIIFAGSGSSRIVSIELRVLAGWEAEPNDAVGVAPLTRQIAFRSENAQTMAELITQAGGKVTLTTDTKQTALRASIPSIKATWALNELSKALMAREISAPLLQTAKEEVLQEQGSPGPQASDLLALLLQGYFIPPGFSESEFGIAIPNRSPEAVRLHVPSLTIQQVQRFFYRYYTPSNVILFVAGPLKKKEMLSFMRETFGGFPDRGRPTNGVPTPTPRDSPFLRSRRSAGIPSVAVGTKFHDIAPEEELVLRAYLKYFAHRLNSTLFQPLPEPDRARAEVWVDPLRFGYGRIFFRAPAQEYSRLRDQVEQRIEAETRHGELSDQQIKETVVYFLRDLAASAVNPESLLDYGDRLYTFRTTYHNALSPFALLQAIAPATFRRHLGKLFAAQNSYVQLEEPPLFFSEESTVLYALVCLASLAFWRWWMKKEFAHTRIRYVRRIRYSRLLCLFLLIGFSALLWSLLQLSYFSDRVLYRWNFFQSSFLINEYGRGAVGLFILCSLTMGFLSWFPRKLMIVGDELVLKTISYQSLRYPLGEIKEIYVLRLWHLLRHGLWRSSLRILHWSLWKKGILIRFRDESGYFLAFDNAEKVGGELREVLQKLKGQPKRVPHHQILKYAPREK